MVCTTCSSGRISLYKVRSVLSEEKKLSIAALSQTLPARLILRQKFDQPNRDKERGCHLHPTEKAIARANKEQRLREAHSKHRRAAGLGNFHAAKRVPMQDPKNERDRVLSSEEWDRLYAAAADHIKPVLLMAYHLGPRLGEILNLPWDRVDLHRGFIKLRAVDTKTKEPREVPLPPMVLAALRDLSKGRSLIGPYVFQFKGKPIKRIKRAFHSAARKAGIANVRFHDLRHCAATNLRRAGVDTVTAMKIVGHKSEKMHRRYNSVSDGDLSTAARRLNSYLSNTVITPATHSAASVAVTA